MQSDIAVNPNHQVNRLSKLRKSAAITAGILAIKVLIGILYEYRWYFPANFEESAFLTGRRPTFGGVYRWAFYFHIIVSPFVILMGAALIFSSRRPHLFRLHRNLGRVQILLALTVVVPSGIVMAYWAYSGPIAGAGFASLAIATAVCSVVAGYQARAATCLHGAEHQKHRARRLRSHRRWATRTLILLASPLLLRIISGLLIVTKLDSEWTYRANAWISWLLPLAIYEVRRIRATTCRSEDAKQL